jgi:hypothetical protein
LQLNFRFRLNKVLFLLLLLTPIPTDDKCVKANGRIVKLLDELDLSGVRNTNKVVLAEKDDQRFVAEMQIGIIPFKKVAISRLTWLSGEHLGQWDTPRYKLTILAHSFSG